MPNAPSFDSPGQTRQRVLALGQIEEEIKDVGFIGGAVEKEDGGGLDDEHELMTFTGNPESALYLRRSSDDDLQRAKGIEIVSQSELEKNMDIAIGQSQSEVANHRS